MGFFYNKIDSIIPTVVLPTTEIIEPKKTLHLLISGAIFLFTPFGFSFQFCPISSHTYTTTEHYSISDIVNSDKTPIPAAKELYDAKLKLAKEGLAKIEKKIMRSTKSSRV